VQFDLTVNSTGYDEAEAKQHAQATALKIDRAGAAMVVQLKYPPEARQRATLTIKVPSRLRVRIDAPGGKLTVSRVAALEAASVGGPTTVSNVTGGVTINQRGVPLTIDGAASVRLTGRAGETKIQRITGAVMVQTAGGELTLSSVTGPVEIDARNTDVRLEQIKAMKPPLRINATDGSVRIDGLRTEARIDGNDTDLEIALAAPAPVTVYNTSQDIAVTAPAAGYTIDAVATDGRITIDDGSIKPTSDATEQRASGSIRGGGAPLTLRATRGDITVRAPAGK
jgi:DUF4097 and DUF4098 domain-containing protein YvlB